jgi:hypothetical protein
MNSGFVTTPVVSTYSLINTSGTYPSSYNGGVLSPNGDIHMIP